MSIQRWTAYIEDDDGNDFHVAFEADGNGRWVKYADHAAGAERAEALARELKAALLYLRGTCRLSVLVPEEVEEAMHVATAALDALDAERAYLPDSVLRERLDEARALAEEKEEARKATHGDQDWIDRANAASYLAAVDAKRE